MKHLEARVPLTKLSPIYVDEYWLKKAIEVGRPSTVSFFVALNACKYSGKGNHWFFANQTDWAHYWGADRKSVKRALDRLVSNGLLEPHSENRRGKLGRYRRVNPE